MPETFSPPQERLTAHEQLRDEQLRRAIGVLVLLMLARNSDLNRLYPRPERTSQSNRERWSQGDFVDTFWPLARQAAPIQGRPNTAYNSGADFFGPDWYNARRFSQNPTHAAETSTGDQPEAPAQTAPNPEPAPPVMPFKFFPSSVQPDKTETEGADRANELMYQGLVGQGWEGGTPNEDQLKKATRTTLSSLHPDRNPDLSEVDLEASKIISGQMNEIKAELYNQPNAEDHTSEDSAPPANEA